MYQPNIRVIKGHATEGEKKHKYNSPYTVFSLYFTEYFGTPTQLLCRRVHVK